MSQTQLMHEAEITWRSGYSITLVSDKEREALLYGIEESQLQEVDWDQPTARGDRCLSSPPLTAIRALQLNPETDNVTNISEKCKGLKRSQRYCILEWVRTHPRMVNLFLRKMREDAIWRGRYGGFYDQIRLSSQRSTNAEVIQIEVLETSLNQKTDRIIAHEEAALERIVREMKRRQIRLDWAKAARGDGALRERVQLRDLLPDLPEDRLRKRYVKRKRGEMDEEVVEDVAAAPSKRHRRSPTEQPEVEISHVDAQMGPESPEIIEIGGFPANRWHRWYGGHGVEQIDGQR